MNKKENPITAVVVGYGFRGMAYSDYAVDHAEQLKIVGVVEPDSGRRMKAKEKFSIPDENCFDSFEKFVSVGKMADCVINATMDKLHIATALPLLKLKYDMLLEKPITSDPAELMKLKKVAEENGCKLIICHVLRYTPFFVTIKKLIDDGKIGKLRHMETSENVAIAHASASYIRGKWNNSKVCGSSYMLAKCCHDIDLICWLNGGTRPKTVTGIGSRNYFVEKNAPINSGTRCLLDCPIEKECQYSIGKMATERNPFSNYIWENYENLNLTKEERINNLKYENPHGRCIFKTDADLVDQQSTCILFEDGTTAVHTLFSGAPEGCRRLHIYGDKGEILGVLDKSQIKLLTYDPEHFSCAETAVPIDMSLVGKGHAGGDYCIMEDFCKTMRGLPRSVSCTDIQDSVNGHLCVYASDLSMKEKRFVDIKEFTI